MFAGVAFVLHGWGKVADVSGFAAEQGVPVVLGAAAAYVQFIGGLLLVVGLLTPLAAFGIGVTMVVAVVIGFAALQVVREWDEVSATLRETSLDD